MKYGIKISKMNDNGIKPYWGEAPFADFRLSKFHKTDRTFITDDINIAFKCRNKYFLEYGSYWNYMVEERE